MGFFKRKDMHGKDRRGLWSGLAAFFLIIGLVLYFTRDTRSAEEKKRDAEKQDADKVQVDVAEVARAAGSFDKVQEGEKKQSALERPSETATGFGEQEKVATKKNEAAPDDSAIANPIAAALSAARPVANDESGMAKKIDEESGLPAERVDPTSSVASANDDGVGGDSGGAAASSDRGGREVKVEVQKLSVFHRSKTLLPATPKVVQAPSGFETNDFLPKGHPIPVYILSLIETSSMENMVEMGVAENVVFNHRVMLPFGTRIYGTASGDAVRDRLAITADTIVYPDGKELPISGLLFDEDGGSGVRGYYLPSPLWTQALPYAEKFLVLWDQAMRQQRQSAAAAVVQSAVSVVAPQFNARNTALDSASDAALAFINKQQERLDKRYQDFLRIPPGTQATIHLRNALDLNQAKVNGSKDNKQPVLPGFENNPIQPNGEVSPHVAKAVQQGISAAQSAVDSIIPKVSGSRTADADSASTKAAQK